MADRDARHRASEALRLVNEPLLIEALETIRMSAFHALAEVDPTDMAKITQLQARAAVCLEIVSELQAVIVAGPADPPEK